MHLLHGLGWYAAHTSGGRGGAKPWNWGGARVMGLAGWAVCPGAGSVMGPLQESVAAGCGGLCRCPWLAAIPPACRAQPSDQSALHRLTQPKRFQPNGHLQSEQHEMEPHWSYPLFTYPSLKFSCQHPCTAAAHVTTLKPLKVHTLTESREWTMHSAAQNMAAPEWLAMKGCSVLLGLS